MKADDIALGLRKAVQGGMPAEKAVDSLKTLLERAGAVRLLPRILTSYQRLISRESVSEATLTVAKQSDADLLLSKESHVALTKPKVIIDETLIGGHIYRVGGKRIDASHKGALLNLYHKITSDN
jgi:F0F1-type ATP synthase delta subunit